MLVLTRAKKDSVLIGDNISVTILGISRGQVKLGFKAPNEFDIVRDELVSGEKGSVFNETFNIEPEGEKPEPGNAK